MFPLLLCFRLFLVQDLSTQSGYSVDAFLGVPPGEMSCVQGSKGHVSHGYVCKGAFNPKENNKHQRGRFEEVSFKFGEGRPVASRPVPLFRWAMQE